MCHEGKGGGGVEGGGGVVVKVFDVLLVLAAEGVAGEF